VAALVLGLLLLELALRWLIFAGGSYGAPLQRPDDYAHPATDEHWALLATVRPRGPDTSRFEDPLVGWTNELVAPASYVHRDAVGLEGRAPLLLYGDSFAACLTDASACFQGLLERSDLGRDSGLLNYGINGFGPGQVYLLLRETLDHHRQREPVVIVGIYLDEDLSRTPLSLRQHPKPRFYLDENGLRFDPPLPGGRSAWLEQNGIGIRSYVASFFLRRMQASGTPELEDLNRAVLMAIQEEIQERGLRYFALLFPGLDSLQAPEPGWEEVFVESVLNEIGFPFVSARHDLEEEAVRAGIGPEEFFAREGAGVGHFDARGNEVAFRALRRGLSGDFDGGQ